MAATQATNTTPHIPVLLAEVLDALKPQDLGIYVDGTFGRGGYTRTRQSLRIIEVPARRSRRAP